jgi:hypothetical protein
MSGAALKIRRSLPAATRNIGKSSLHHRRGAA